MLLKLASKGSSSYFDQKIGSMVKAVEKRQEDFDNAARDLRLQKMTVFNASAQRIVDGQVLRSSVSSVDCSSRRCNFQSSSS